MRSVLSAATVAAAVFSAGRAAAQDESLRFTWYAPTGCPSGEDVKSAALRGVDRQRVPSGTLVAEASVEQQSPSSWRVRLKTRRGNTAGEREIEGPTCAGVADATAVLLALALVPPTAVPEAPPVPVPPPPAPTPIAPPPAPRSSTPVSHHVAIGLAGVADVGSLPSVALGGAADVAWTPGPLRIEVEGRILAKQTENVAGKTSGASFSKKSVGGRACFAVVQSSSFDLSPCAGMGVEVMSASGSGAGQDFTPTKAWGALSAGGLGRVFLAEWLALRGRVELNVPLYRPNFVVVGEGSVFHPPTVGAAAYFGAEVLFL